LGFSFGIAWITVSAVKTLLDLCNEYGIPIHHDGEGWRGPCLWSFDESASLTIHPDEDRWDDWVKGFSGDTIQFVIMVEERLRFLGRDRFTPNDWFGEPAEPLPF
jgi:hypothetical protein